MKYKCFLCGIPKARKTCKIFQLQSHQPKKALWCKDHENPSPSKISHLGTFTSKNRGAPKTFESHQWTQFLPRNNALLSRDFNSISCQSLYCVTSWSPCAYVLTFDHLSNHKQLIKVNILQHYEYKNANILQHYEYKIHNFFLYCFFQKLLKIEFWLSSICIL